MNQTIQNSIISLSDMIKKHKSTLFIVKHKNVLLNHQNTEETDRIIYE